MDRPRLFVELCAGSAAVSLRLVGGPNANPPIGMMGGKRGYARAILGVLGLRQGLGADEVWLNDAGPWGPVWACLTTPGQAEEVAAIIRGWKDEEPRALWERLKAEGWGELTEVGEVAGWVVVNAGSYGSAPVTWTAKGARIIGGITSDGSCMGRPVPPSFKGPEAATVGGVASRVEAVARWLVCGAWSFRMGEPDSGINPRNWKGEERTETSNGCNPQTVHGVASRLSSWPTPVRAFHGSALDVPIPEDCEGVYVYADPSYKHPDGTATTGYAQNIYAEDLRERLLEWSGRGAVVCVSDARPLGGLFEGWHEVDIGRERVGQRRTFGLTREWLTLNREPAWTPSVQVGLFGAQP